MNQLMGIDFRKLALVDANQVVGSIGSLNCIIRIWGASHHFCCIRIYSDAENFQRIAITLLACAIGTQHQVYLPVDTGDLAEKWSYKWDARPGNSFAKGIRITAVRPSIDQPKSFTYTPKRRLKRYPWFPWSITCDPQTELPVFTLAGMPGETDCPRLWDGRRDLREPHMVCIGGHPKALIRLARLLLDYSDTNIPSDIDIVLETGGGLRGVGPLSNEARFERVDPCRCAACVGDSS
ncbi:hypothetical protein [Verminephrobacter eiseniae]|uniref:hypothetical protein n=1 Tax=Verminephrobacter eiseniae TaxID=364317 RepID=UPI00223898C4|nr:hypothetical protein [Verminephrobacter eiseniae]MCW5232060.1 hypothetical protein [Verminephrobacter eiseniae]MCW5296378.1 hypothetical protein [Verminephrobacter eiseniae]MCW8186554.1 hypothetical protein [Verminephrobacter eiseniae]MCW8224973.1 hypothetical protein [Verminephrobacter eiseniae]MCW8232929.1 hypothetical protein [Verminephrobacter eiseniae]